MTYDAELKRTVHEAGAGDTGRGVARLAMRDLQDLGINIGDLLAIDGARTTYARAMPFRQNQKSEGSIQIDGLLRQNAGAAIGEAVIVKPTNGCDAQQISFTFSSPTHQTQSTLQRLISKQIQHIPLSEGDHIRIRLMGGGDVLGKVNMVAPKAPVFLSEHTQISIQIETQKTSSSFISYEDLGGLGSELARVREMIELPIRRPDIFQHLGIEAPKGVLLSGPPGTGKTLLARAIAHECDASFFQVNGPEIVSKHYGESEKQLRAVFQQAESKAPSIIFIDELDAIAPKRENLNADRQLERRIVAQLLTLLDGMTARGHVIILASTNLPDMIDPALRRPGRFDREISLGVPDRKGRLEIFQVHTRGMPLAETVDLQDLARVTHGFVGADIAAVCREAGMAVLRKFHQSEALYNSDVGIQTLSVDKADFETALMEVRPSALREVSTDIPDTTWSDIGGLEEVKQTLIEAVIWPLKHQKLFESFAIEPAKGVLLSGAPGTGKTLLARALANEAEVNFISVRGPQLLNQYLGESEKAVRDIFSKARATAPSILFFDELDALTPSRGGEHNGTLDQIVAQFLTEIDGITELKGVFLLGATNRADCIDAALLRPGRFDHIIHMPLPDQQTRHDILKIHSERMPVTDKVDYEQLARRTEGFVGADLKLLCQITARITLKKTIESLPSQDEMQETEAYGEIHMAHFEQALSIMSLQKTS